MQTYLLHIPEYVQRSLGSLESVIFYGPERQKKFQYGNIKLTEQNMVKYLQQYKVKEGDKFGLVFLYFLLGGSSSRNASFTPFLCKLRLGEKGDKSIK